VVNGLPDETLRQKAKTRGKPLGGFAPLREKIRRTSE